MEYTQLDVFAFTKWIGSRLQPIPDAEIVYLPPERHYLRRMLHIVSFTCFPLIFYNFFGIYISLMHLYSLMMLQAGYEYIRLQYQLKTYCTRSYEMSQISGQAWAYISMFMVLILSYPRTYSLTNDENAAQIGMPILLSFAVGDVILGELRRLYLIKQSNYKIVYSSNNKKNENLILNNTNHVRHRNGINLSKNNKNNKKEPKINDLNSTKKNDKNQKNIIIRYLIMLVGYCIILFIYILCHFLFYTPLLLIIIMPPITVLAEWPNLRYFDDNGLMQLIPLFVVLILEVFRLI